MASPPRFCSLVSTLLAIFASVDLLSRYVAVVAAAAPRFAPRNRRRRLKVSLGLPDLIAQWLRWQASLNRMKVNQPSAKPAATLAFNLNP